MLEFISFELFDSESDLLEKLYKKEVSEKVTFKGLFNIFCIQKQILVKTKHIEFY
jgi:hypothetical protein